MSGSAAGDDGTSGGATADANGGDGDAAGAADAGDGSDGTEDGDWEVSQDLPEVPGSGDGGAEEGGGEGEGAAANAADGNGQSPDAAGDALAEALGDFDGEILRERLAAERRAAAANRDPLGTGASESEGEPGSGTGQRSVAPKAPVSAPKPPTPPPPDTPDARDDDVVARQIREAAEKETDPELKEQLWKEYERYKSRR